MTSRPSRPPSRQRRAASAKAATIRRMSASSISLGKLRWAGSRTDDGAIVGQPVAVVPDGPAAHVGQLDHRRRAVRVHPVGQLSQPRDDVVVAGVQLAEDRR